MLAGVFTGFEGPDDIAIHEQDEPEPNSNEVVVSVEASALNHHDLWILEGSGAIGSEGPPFVSGVDLAGTVESVGTSVDQVSQGDRVVLCPIETCGTCRYCREGPENRCGEFSLYHGGFAEKAVVDPDRLITLPESVSPTDAAALPVAYMTAWHMLRQADAGAGDLVFVPGATGGVGIAAMQLIDVIGARSIGSTGSPAKAERLTELGVDYVLETDDPDALEKQVLEIGEPDVMLNHLGGQFTEIGMSVLRRGGAMVCCGGTAGGQSTIDVRGLYLSHKRLIGSTMGTQQDLARVLEFVEHQEFSPVIGQEYQLEELAEAFRDMQNRDLFGKLIVHP